MGLKGKVGMMAKKKQEWFEKLGLTREGAFVLFSLIGIAIVLYLNSRGII